MSASSRLTGQKVGHLPREIISDQKTYWHKGRRSLNYGKRQLHAGAQGFQHNLKIAVKTKDISPRGNETNYSYTSNGDISSVTDPLGKITQFFYDAFRKFRGIALDPSGINIRASYDYDLNGNLTKVTRHSGGESKINEYKYNDLNQPIQEIDLMGNLKTYEYYASFDSRAGLIQKKTRPSGITATYDYNANNEESRVTYANPSSGASLDFVFTNDADGKLATIDLNGVAITTHYYNNDGLLWSVGDHTQGTPSAGWWASGYIYDDDNRNTLVQQFGNQPDIQYNSKYQYDSMSNVTYVGTGKCYEAGYFPCHEDVSTVWASSSFIYDDKNQVAGMSRGNASISYLDHDVEGNLTGSYTGRNATLLVKENASYDALNNLTRHAYTYKNTSSTDTARLNVCTYDAVNRLVSADVNGTTYGYTYDNFGNLTQKKKGASTDSFRYNQGDQLASYDMNGVTYYASYDTDGNMLSDGLYQYSWNLLGKIYSITTSTDTTNYEYQHNGLRLSKKVGSGEKTVFTYDQNNQLIAEHTASADLTAMNTWVGGKLISHTKYTASTDSYSTYYLHADVTGNIVSVTDKNGTVVKTYEYDPYGNVLSSTGTLEQPFQYKGAFGYYTDKETGLIYLQQRYYSPKLMRFLSQDPLNCNCEGEIKPKLANPLDINPYVYVVGNPVMGIDPTGEGLVLLGIGLALGGLTIIGAYTAVTVSVYCGEWWWKLTVKNNGYWSYAKETEHEKQVIMTGEREQTDYWCRTQVLPEVALEIYRQIFHVNWWVPTWPDVID